MWNYVEKSDVSSDGKSAWHLSERTVDVLQHCSVGTLQGSFCEASTQEHGGKKTQTPSTHRRQGEEHAALNQSPSPRLYVHLPASLHAFKTGLYLQRLHNYSLGTEISNRNTATQCLLILYECY